MTLAEHGDDAALYEHIDAYADNSDLLRTFLCALSAAAEETPARAATARRIWPNVIGHVLALDDSRLAPEQHGHYDDRALPVLIPNATYPTQYLYPEVQDSPIPWWEPLALQPVVEAWLPAASGSAICVDRLISFLGVLASEDQVRTGLTWVATLVLADPASTAGRTFLLPDWLIETRSAAVDVGLSASWQEVVDALVVAGVTRLAPYSA